MNPQTRIELHSERCSCRGGSWVLLEGATGSPCSGGSDEAATGEKVVVTLKEWRQAGKPGNLELYREAEKRAASGERRQFQRFQVSLKVQLSRITSWREPAAQTEETTTDALAAGGALVRSRMAVEKGQIIQFAVGDDYETRAEVTYVSTGEGPGQDGIPRLGLKFLDAPLPDSLIPEDAEPLP
jgi:hypothetical protein